MKNNQILLHDVGALIRKLRKEKRMSGVDLGAELGISQQQISRYENATSEISVSTLINILAVFNITPVEFFTRIYDTEHHSFRKYTTRSR
ncbi:helix-turn-helix domain-containing protein [Morganella morganii]|uniref:Helix-turn-helix transcriptional regulator n=1 Tax=Morganella morganii TaxID=582 RepID=A0AAN5MIN9_MORMO|nr:helix-turn-helix transcriptional regulator [Morganella morganii]MCU6378102.1 helix-turn-helix domain-containing protein [Morganella morganii]HAT3810928.1 helix-turn-helix transcriptional regulator [Morganella morganii]HED3889749.1 helix-turn-helix transcriptional regulator [Morganella morganii]